METIKSEPTKTVLTIAIGFLVLYIMTDLRWLLYTSLVVGIIGITSVHLTKMVNSLWMKLAYLLSLIVPNILLTVIFYLFLLPIATLSKLFGKRDSMNLKNTKQSLFKTLDKEFSPDSFENPW